MERLLRRKIESADKLTAHRVTQQLAELYAKTSHYAAAAKFYERLRSQFADVPGEDGRTGRQVYDALSADGGVLRGLAPRRWPEGKVIVKPEDPTAGPAGAFSVPLLGSETEFFRGLTFRWDTQLVLEAQSPEGGVQWRAKFKQPDDTNGRSSAVYGQRLINQGHLLVYSNGCFIYGIDGAGGKNARPGEVLWRHRLTDNVGSSLDQLPNPRIINTPWGERSIQFSSRIEGMLGSLTPAVTPERVIFLRGRELLAVEAFTGKILWRRDDMPPGGAEVLVGDGRAVVVGLQPALARVFRLEDGMEEADRQAPPVSEWVATFGSRIVRWREVNGRVELSLVDALAGNEIWRRMFATGAKASRAGDELGVVEPDGSFTLLSLREGEIAFAAPLEKCTRLRDVILLSDAKRYVLAVNEGLNVAKLRAQGFNRVLSVATQFGSHSIYGRLQAFDRQTGKLLWIRPVEGFSILTNQAPESPALAVALLARTMRQMPNGRTSSNVQATVALIDKRDGRVLYKGTIGNSSAAITGVLHADADKKSVQFASSTGGVSLQFTEEPRGENAPDEKLMFDPQPAEQPAANDNPFGVPVPPQRIPAPAAPRAR